MQKKLSLFALYKILNDKTDENHRLSRRRIEQIMEQDYDIKIDRKTLHQHIELLNQFDCDIHSATSAQDGYYMGQRLFEPSEVHLLCNAIYAAHFIPEKASNDLIKKILSTQSQYQKKEFINTVYMKNMRKTMNKEFFLNVELLNEAIQMNKAVSFNYVKYNLKKELIPRRERPYVIHPYYIIFANENYYLICKNDEYEDLSHYRIDKMQHIEILEKARKPLEKSFDPYAYARTKFYMYGGKEELVTLRCDYKILDDIIDKFGNDVILQPVDASQFLAILKVARQGLIYFVLQYIRYCEVCAPIDLKNTIKEILNSALSKSDPPA